MNIDSSSWSYQQFFQVASLVLLTKKEVRLSFLPDSVHSVFSQCKVLGLELTRLDAGVLLHASKKPLVREYTFTLPEEIPVYDVFTGFLPIFLFSNLSLQYTFKGRTHATDRPSILWCHELLFRYVRKYLTQYAVGVPQARLDVDGVLEIHVKSKQKLSRVISPLTIQAQKQLSHFVIELIAAKEEQLEQQEKLLRLALASQKVPLRFETRIADFGAFSILAFFGSAYGYDNDFAFLHGKSFIQEKAFTQDVHLALLKQFLPSLSSQLLGMDETLALVPLLSLVGGSLPCEATREELRSLLQFFSEYLGIDYYTSEQLLETEGYAPLHAPEILDIDEL